MRDRQPLSESGQSASTHCRQATSSSSFFWEVIKLSEKCRPSVFADASGVRLQPNFLAEIPSTVHLLPPNSSCEAYRLLGLGGRLVASWQPSQSGAEVTAANRTPRSVYDRRWFHDDFLY